MTRTEFDRLVDEAVAGLPAQFRAAIENVALVVENAPTRAQLDEAGLDGYSLLLGLYRGIPLTERLTNYGMVAPDVIYIFQKPIEAICHNDDEIRAQIQETVRHEVAHYFGISDERLDEIEAGRGRP